MSDNISRQAASKKILGQPTEPHYPSWYAEQIKELPSAQPKSGQWILDRSGAYCCSECMEPCAGYVMMKPRDKFCKMCGAKMEEVTE